jgi:2-octaprenylphenol hydroxylase
VNLDILVIGSGVVGSALAIKVSKLGYKVAIVDSKESPPNSLRHLSINQKSKSFLKEIGIWENIKNSAFPYERIKVWDQEGTGFIDFNAKEAQLPNLGYIVREGEIQKNLIQKFNENKVESFWGETVQRVNFSSDEIFCETDKQTHIAKMIIGCDGMNSKIRELSEINYRSWSYNQTAVVANFKTSINESCIKQTFTSVGPLALLPINDKESTMIWSIDDDVSYKFLAMSDEEFTSEVVNKFGEQIEELNMISKRQHFPLHHLSAKTFAKKGIFLVGDSAHHIHPLAGLGLNSGIGDVICLSELIESNSLENLEEIILAYNRKRIPINLGLAASMEAFKRGFGQKNIWLRLFRNTAFNFANKMSPLKKKFMELATEL